AAAVGDWRPAQPAAQKLKKDAGAPTIELVRNPDILAILAEPGNRRPRLVVGFAAETENLIENARRKLAAKGCDWIVANDVGAEGGPFGGERNTAHLVSAEGVEDWPRLDKTEIGERLAQRIAARLATAP